MNELGLGGGESGGTGWALEHSFLKVGGYKEDMNEPEEK